LSPIRGDGILAAMDKPERPLALIRFEATVIYWRGPSPFFYAPVPLEQAGELARLARVVSYGWGMIPVAARIGAAAFTTALFPKDGTYLLPIKAAARRKAEITAGDSISVEMEVLNGRR
jgi:hypothetical protein